MSEPTLDDLRVRCKQIDLNRLREAAENGWTQFENHGDTMVAMPRPRFDEYHQTTRAVLDAPTVRWCLEHGSVFWGGGHHGAVERCEWTTDEKPPYDCRFGSAVVVPVKGGQE